MLCNVTGTWLVSGVTIRVVDENEESVEDAEVTVDGREYNKPQVTSQDGYLRLYIQGPFAIQVKISTAELSLTLIYS